MGIIKMANFTREDILGAVGRVTMALKEISIIYEEAPNLIDSLENSSEVKELMEEIDKLEQLLDGL